MRPIANSGSPALSMTAYAIQMRNPPVTTGLPICVLKMVADAVAAVVIIGRITSSVAQPRTSIIESAGEPEFSASFHLLKSATKQRLLPWSLPSRMRKTVFFFVLFQR
jgi:hypothetical protein